MLATHSVPSLAKFAVAPGNEQSAKCHVLNFDDHSIEKHEYKSWLQTAREARDSVAIPNELPWHSHLAVMELMRHAIDLQQEIRVSGSSVTVKLLTGTLSANVYCEDWRQLVNRFVGDGGSVQIIVWNDRFPEGASALRRSCGAVENLDIRLTNTREGGDQINHFLLVGDSAYRNEMAHPYYDAGEFGDFGPKIPAQICFNNPSTGGRLSTLFNSVWELLTPSSASANIHRS